MKILVYQDEGVALGCLGQLLDLLNSFIQKKNLQQKYEILTVDAAYLLAESWESDTKLVVIPGGRDLPYLDKLGLAIFRSKIMNFLKTCKTVHFLGICAGAYFASKELYFACSAPFYESVPDLGPNSITGERLNLVNAIAIGPLPCGNDTEYIMKICVSSTECNVYYNQGCYFEIPSDSLSDNISIIASVDCPSCKPLPVIIRKFFPDSQSSVLLSGVHFEVFRSEPPHLLLGENFSFLLESTELTHIAMCDYIFDDFLKE